MNILATLTLAAALVISLPAFGQGASAHASHHDASTQAPLTDGEVRKVDKEAKKITIKHGPIVNLDMPAMTMVFQVKDPAMLEQINAGDKIKFAADKLDGAFTVTRIEPAK